jgi:hypothetical protein
VRVYSCLCVGCVSHTNRPHTHSGQEAVRRLRSHKRSAHCLRTCMKVTHTTCVHAQSHAHTTSAHNTPSNTRRPHTHTHRHARTHRHAQRHPQPRATQMHILAAQKCAYTYSGARAHTPHTKTQNTPKTHTHTHAHTRTHSCPRTPKPTRSHTHTDMQTLCMCLLLCIGFCRSPRAPTHTHTKHMHTHGAHTRMCAHTLHIRVRLVHMRPTPPTVSHCMPRRACVCVWTSVGAQAHHA